MQYRASDECAMREGLQSRRAAPSDGKQCCLSWLEPLLQWVPVVIRSALESPPQKFSASCLVHWWKDLAQTAIEAGGDLHFARRD